MQSQQIEQWLDALPLDEPVDVDGETVLLALQPGGATLGAQLSRAATGVQLADAMRTGFQSALEFEAGLSLGDDGSLMLTQWLPGAESWRDAGDALEGLLNQVAMWRAAMAPGASTPAAESRRDADRIRQLFSGETR